MLSIHSSEQIKSVTMVVTGFFIPAVVFSRNYFSSFALSVFVSLSMTPDDKRDLIMPSLDRRTKGRSLSFYCSCCAKSEKKKKKKKKKRKEE
jgi:hypothetical protein